MQMMPERRKVPASEHCGSPAFPLRRYYYYIHIFIHRIGRNIQTENRNYYYYYYYYYYFKKTQVVKIPGVKNKKN